MNNNHVIEVNDFVVKSKAKVNTLSRRQEFVCRMFDITPKEEFYVDAQFEIPSKDVFFYVGDVFMDEIKQQWRCMSIVKGVNPSESIRGADGQEYSLVVVSSVNTVGFTYPVARLAFIYTAISTRATTGRPPMRREFRG